MHVATITVDQLEDLMDKPLSHFRLKQLTKFKDLEGGEGKFILQESDLCFQNQEYIAQFEHVDSREEQRIQIEPGIYTMIRSNGMVALRKTEPRRRQLLKSIDNTQAILTEAKTFFSRLHVYERLGLPKKRGILLYSAPGLGKSAAITQFIVDATTEDPGTVVMLWPTAEVEASDVSKFLSVFSEYDPACTRLILVMEDIGGAVHEGHGGPRRTDAAMLNLLDGIDVTFKLPTFIIATTNFPQNLLSSLADRPGRFDRLIELLPPNYAERVELLEFIAKRALTDEEKDVFKNKEAEEFSIAHLEEIVVRSELHEKTLAATFKEIVDHRKIFKEAFEKQQSMGFGSRDSLDDF